MNFITIRKRKNDKVTKFLGVSSLDCCLSLDEFHGLLDEIGGDAFSIAWLEQREPSNKKFQEILDRLIAVNVQLGKGKISCSGIYDTVNSCLVGDDNGVFSFPDLQSASEKLTSNYKKETNDFYLYPALLQHGGEISPLFELIQHKERYYFVSVEMLIDEYEKESFTFLTASSRDEAEELALICECHDTPKFEKDSRGRKICVDGDFLYRISAIKEIKKHEFDLFNKISRGSYDV